MTIDVQPFIDKLEVLKEYMCLKIDGIGSGIWINLDAMSAFTPKEIFEIWQQTGWMMYTSPKPSDYPEPKELTFEEFYKQKINP